MERIKKFLQDVANNDSIKVTNSKIEQRTRNAIRNEFTDLLTKVLQDVVGCQDIVIARTKEGVGIALDNAKVGFIPIVLKPVFKDTAEDILDLAEDYEREQAEKKAKAEEKQKAKERKIKRDKARAESVPQDTIED